MSDTPSLVHISLATSPENDRTYEAARRIVELCKEHGVGMVGVLCDAEFPINPAAQVTMTAICTADDHQMVDPLIQAATDHVTEEDA